MANNQLFFPDYLHYRKTEAQPVTVEEEENLTEVDVSTWEGHSFEENLGYEVYEAVPTVF